jgi:uncharacterized protein (DUF169 family)
MMASFQENVDGWMDILGRLNLEIKPVAVRFLIRRPDGIDRLEKNMSFCEMLKEAQGGNSFYADADNHTCEAGAYILGIKDAPPPFTNGEYGAGLKVFKEPRSARRIYQLIPKIEKGTVNCVAFSPLEKVSFEPDLLVLFADVSQADILLRAMSYTTCKMWSSKFTSVLGCAWVFNYPYLTGELNYGITGLGFGMKLRKLFPEGLFLISMPYDLFPLMLENLQDMPWVLPAFEADGLEFRRRLRIELGLEPSL